MFCHFIVEPVPKRPAAGHWGNRSCFTRTRVSYRPIDRLLRLGWRLRRRDEYLNSAIKCPAQRGSVVCTWRRCSWTRLDENCNSSFEDIVLKQALQRLFYCLRAPVTQIAVIFLRSCIVGMTNQTNVCDRLQCLPAKFNVPAKVFDQLPETRCQRGSIPNKLIESQKFEVLGLWTQAQPIAPGGIPGPQLRQLLLKPLF